jgi:hypothetical protein
LHKSFFIDHFRHFTCCFIKLFIKINDLDKISEQSRKISSKSSKSGQEEGPFSMKNAVLSENALKME